MSKAVSTSAPTNHTHVNSWPTRSESLSSIFEKLELFFVSFQRQSSIFSSLLDKRGQKFLEVQTETKSLADTVIVLRMGSFVTTATALVVQIIWSTKRSGPEPSKPVSTEILLLFIPKLVSLLCLLSYTSTQALFPWFYSMAFGCVLGCVQLFEKKTFREPRPVWNTKWAFCTGRSLIGYSNRYSHELLCLTGKGRGGTGTRRHNKGCNCKRSGCLKNYCECYEVRTKLAGFSGSQFSGCFFLEEHCRERILVETKLDTVLEINDLYKYICFRFLSCRLKSCVQIYANVSAARTSRRAQTGKPWCTSRTQPKCEFNNKLQQKPNYHHRSRTCLSGCRRSRERGQYSAIRWYWDG